MRPIRIVTTLAATALAASLTGHAAQADRKSPAPEATAPAVGSPPSSADRTDYPKQQEGTMKPPTDASMGAIERKPGGPTDGPGNATRQ